MLAGISIPDEVITGFTLKDTGASSKTTGR